MRITAVDNDNNLFAVDTIFSADLVEKIIATDWPNLPWQRQPGQEKWARRLIEHHSLVWIAQWHAQLQQHWHTIGQTVNRELSCYMGTAFWLDEPGFTCPLHTDGMMPGSMQLTWIDASRACGTAFYWYKNKNSLRCQFSSTPNTGYIMINSSDENYQQLLWHAMLTPVPENTFRLTSYTWIQPVPTLLSYNNTVGEHYAR